MNRPVSRGALLVVDDDAATRKLMRTLFVDAGYDVIEAENGSEALVRAHERRPSLVLLDVVLPGLSGYETCRRLRERYGEDLAIIFVSGQRIDSYDRTAGLMIGADDYVVKPFSQEELLARVRRLTRTRQRNNHPVADDDPLNELTAREAEVLDLLADGLHQREIAQKLVISDKTVGTHIQHVLEKLGVHNRTQAVALAHRRRATSDS